MTFYPVCRGILSLLLFGLSAASVWAQTPPPNLVVVLVVDQMRADYIDTYGHLWRAGLRRLLDDGARFHQAAYPFRSTLTCAGHATIATGTFPAKHGMIGNDWWDRGSGQRVTCTTDARAEPIGYGSPARERHSPHTLAMPTLPDVLRLDSARQPRIVSLSLKPRTAITLAGQRADAVVWFDETRVWATSAAYADRPVTAVQQFLDQHPIDVDADAVWTRLLPPESYLHDDADPAERPPGTWNNTFPHPLGVEPDFLSNWRESPFSDAYLAKMAVGLTAAFQLGQGAGTDYLAIGFSALDLVGHDFGPRSHEVQDVLARLDVTIGALLKSLNDHVGPNGYVIALTSDHGVAPIPERAVTLGLDAGRIPTQEILQKLEGLLTARLGPGPHVAALRSGNLYFQPGTYDRLRQNPADVEAVRTLVAASPGIRRVYLDDEVQRAGPDDPLGQAARLSYYPGRSGDLILIPKPYWIATSDATTHGTPHDYDTRVPVVLFGAGIRAGEYLAPITPADIAPTLAFLAGVTLPQPDGRVLIEALER